MDAKEKAVIITEKVRKSQGSKKLHPTDKTTSLLLIDEIISAIEITVGHLTLKINDRLEVNNDVQFWRDVKKEIEKIG